MVQKTLSDTDDTVQSHMTRLDETLAVVQSIAAARVVLCEPNVGSVDILKDKASRVRVLYSKIDALDATIAQYEAALGILEARAGTLYTLSSINRTN